MDIIKRIFRNALYSFKGLYGFLDPKTYVLVKIINPVFQVCCFSMIAKHSYGNVDITPYVIGNSFLLCTINAFFGVGTSLIGERQLGTLKVILASPADKFVIFTSKSLFYIIDGIITVIIGLITGIVFWGINIQVVTNPYFILCVMAAVFSTCSMGLLIGSVGLITRDINLLLNLASMIIMCLAGVDFPIDRLPGFLQFVSNALPLTNSLKASKMIIAGNNNVGMMIFYEVVVGAIYIAVAYSVFKFMERMSIKHSLVDIY